VSLHLDKLQTKLRSEGGIKALLGMVRCRHPDVHAQVARGIANFAKCESRASSQGNLCKQFAKSRIFIVIASICSLKWKQIFPH